MKEDKITTNLREAIHREGLSRPPMPKDLNARLMQRVEKEVNGAKPKKKARIIWPWIAAACAAGIMVIYLTPPKATQSPEGESQVAQVVKDSMKQDRETLGSDEAQPLIAKVKRESSGRQQGNAPVVAKAEEDLMAKTECSTVAKADAKVTADAPVLKEKSMDRAEKPHIEPNARTLTEHDFAITRPENLKYTKEELALMKRQANEAYVKWVELELEIAKYNQEQTAAR